MAAPHDHHLTFLKFIDLITAQVEAVHLGVPKLEEPSKEPFGLADHDVVAAVASLLALPRCFVGRRDQDLSKLLHPDVEQDEGEEEEAQKVADRGGQPLLGDPPFGELGLRAFFSCFKY